MGKHIALLGGSFNPIHLGHMAMAREALLSGMDEVILLPAGDPPHKERELESKWDRLEMVRLASGGLFQVSDMEVLREGKTYTVDTLEEMGRLHPGDTLWMIIGADTLGKITTWKNAPQVFQRCRFLVFSRAGYRPEVPEGACVRFVDAEIPDISSTMVRKAIAEGKNLEGFLPESVENYIGKRRLYHPPALRSYAEIEETLRRELKDSRFEHTLGVVETMKKLARAWNMDEEQAALCGLLHDCAKNLPLEKMQEWVLRAGYREDELRMNAPALLHGAAGAARARMEFGVTDPEILQAIREHTTGGEGMTPLSDMLYLADLTEPGRRPFPGLEKVRALMEKEPVQALILSMEGTLAYVQSSGQAVHPDTLRALEDVKRRLPAPQKETN